VTRGGRKGRAEEPERRCIASRETRPRYGLIRFVVGPDDVVVPDFSERLPGRGMWVSAERAALDLAVRKNLFARAAKRAVRVPPDLAAQVEAGLARRLVDFVALARRAGAAVAGREKVLDRLRAGRAAILIQAADGSEREKRALRPPEGEDTHVTSLFSGELGMAFGRDRVIHAALDGGGLAERVRVEALRLRGFRSDAAPGGPERDAAGHRPRDESGEGPRDERLVENG
jgi:predicted RNA-binding protein YlxR (DUF448 family)